MNVLMLTIYPLDQPRHGGQLRARNILETYRSAGFQIKVAGVLSGPVYSRTEGFVACPPMLRLALIHRRPDLMVDYAIGVLFATDDDAFRQLAGQIDFRPDVIHVEQPWLWGFAARYAATLGPHRPRIVYSSHNVEHEVKHAIFNANKGRTAAQEAAELVSQMEIAAIRQADAIICVSASDACWTAGFSSNPIRVAGNGVAPWHSSPKGVRQAQEITEHFPYAVFCSSAHIPNMEGFFEMFGGGFGSLSPDQRLVLVGSAGEAVGRSPRFHQSARLPERTLIAGVVDTECLAALLDAAHCIVLPVTQGSGTNLKAAEALWSGKHIVSTTKAMRGFEDFICSPGIEIADTPAAFKQALRRAMARPALILSDEERVRRREVLWSECLAQLPELLRSICPPR